MILSRPALTSQPLNPWDRPQSFEGPAGEWVIEFMEKLIDRKLNYILSAWNSPFDQKNSSRTLGETTTLWKQLLKEWEKRFGFDGCVYIDLSNEFPHFLNNHLENSIQEHGSRWSPSWNNAIREEINSCLRELRNEGIPLTTSESWASWFYIDHPDMDWSWLLDWAEWSVEDAIDFNMWGWTPHNYCQPQFENWKDLNWHRRLTSKFLRS